MSCYCNSEDRAWDGEDLKFKITLEANGFSMENDNYRLMLKRGSKKLEVEDYEIVKDGEDYFLCLKADRLQQIGIGEVFLVAYADVPDAHFQDGIRTEIDRQKLYSVVRV